MAFDEFLASRLREMLTGRSIQERKMFGGLCFLHHGNLLVGVWKNSLIVRLGPDEGGAALREPNVKVFDITSKPMKNWVLIAPEGIESEEQLKDWVERATKFVAKLPKKPTRQKASKSKAPENIDQYISQFSTDVQAILEEVRDTIRQVAPEAKEVISYQMPAFKQNGILVYFAGWKSHLGLYPPISGNKPLEKAVARYAGPKGNLQFPLDEPIPLDLIARIVKWRLKQVMEKAAAKKKTQTSSQRRASK
jgi:uncharacterized protein YdhG (YjbR/CyaY superfamily)/TfoX/Sxy family transcriptional regulator of competence genes